MRDRRAELIVGTVLLLIGLFELLQRLGAIDDDLSIWPWLLLVGGGYWLYRVLADRRYGELFLPLAAFLVGLVATLEDLGAIPDVGLLPVILVALGISLLVEGAQRTGARTG